MKLLVVMSIVACATRVGASPLDNDSTVHVMKSELARAVTLLPRSPAKPYFISYAISSEEAVSASAQLGALVASSASNQRNLTVEVRLGDYVADDSTAVERLGNGFVRPRRVSLSLPRTPDPAADRHTLWLATERAYREAAHRFAMKSSAPSSGPAFATEAPITIVDDRPLPIADRARVEALAKQLSAVFRKNPDVYEGTVEISMRTGKHYFVSNEGSVALQTRALIQIEARCESRADDGMLVHEHHRWIVPSLDRLPSDAELAAEIERLSRSISALRKAPAQTHYVGPVLFEGVAAGQIVNVLLRRTLVGVADSTIDPVPRRRRRADPPNVGTKILPDGTSIVDDATQSYRFDAEGVVPQRAMIVENGVLRGFPMSRTPRGGVVHSTGHAAWHREGADIVKLIVSSKKPLADIRKAALATPHSTPFILIVEKLEMRYRENEERVLSDQPLETLVVKRLYADGREELVRGVTFEDVSSVIAGVSLKSLTGIGKTATTFRWSRGATNGAVVAPPLLFDQVSVALRSGWDAMEELPSPVPRP